MQATISAILLLTTIQFTAAYLPPYLTSFKPQQKYRLPDLAFEYSDLEPYINEDTVRNHHQGHHMIYTEKLNTALLAAMEEKPDLKSFSIVDILRNLTCLPLKHQQGIINNGGGYFNHNLYWSILSPNPEGSERVPPNDLALEFQQYFGSFGEFKDQFTKEALKLFGSGYVWLVRQSPVTHLEYSSSPMEIVTTSNQECPISYGSYPILVLDVWEHAYYLKHQYKRAAYVDDWWKVVDWSHVEMLDHWWKTWLNSASGKRDEL